MHNPAVLRYPFLTLDQAAFFLQVPVATARWMYQHDQLPKALRVDGGIFEPVPGRVLVPYDAFEPLVGGSAATVLARWQAGEGDVPKAASPTSPARTLTDVVYKDNGRHDH